MTLGATSHLHRLVVRELWVALQLLLQEVDGLLVLHASASCLQMYERTMNKRTTLRWPKRCNSRPSSPDEASLKLHCNELKSEQD